MAYRMFVRSEVMRLDRPRLRFAPIAGVLASAIAIVCAAPQSKAVVAISSSISVDAVSVPLDPRNPAQNAIGDFTYAGGLQLSSRQTKQLHGLSDLDVTGTDRLTAVGDIGVLFEARLVLDRTGALAGLTDTRLSPLTGEDGKPLSSKSDADAEGVALFPNGDRLVSFERRDRIWLYPAGGGPPHAVPSPKTTFPFNGGMEALDLDPEAGADAYVVGGEISGDTWTCRLSSTECVKGPRVDKPLEFGLSAIKRLPGMRTAYLLRAFDPLRGQRVSLRIVRDGKIVDRMDLTTPMTVDNFEGLAAVPQPDGAIRFYLISDDNASASQRTLLLAFDWRGSSESGGRPEQRYVFNDHSNGARAGTAR